jgi:ABC-type uncharacterized transport system ATPase component
MVMSQVKLIEGVVTDGLRTIFFDQKLNFISEMSSKYNKVSTEFFVYQENGSIKGSPLDSFGGGPSSIISLILRILVLLRLKKRRFLVLDETLAAISDDYIEPTGNFLKKLSSTIGLPILMVTHKTSFLDYSDTSYQGDSEFCEGNNQFVIKK